MKVMCYAFAMILATVLSAILAPDARASSLWPADGNYVVTQSEWEYNGYSEHCSLQTVRVYYYLNHPQYPPTDREVCVYETQYGSVTNSGHIKRFVGGYVQLGRSAIPVPGTTKMYSRLCGYPCRLYTYDTTKGFSAMSSNYGYQLFPKATEQPFLLPGRTIATAIGAVGYSADGRWLALQAEGRFVRYDTLTGEFRKFSNSRGSYGVGMDPTFNLSVSDDGRYIALLGSNYNRLTIFDMDKCTGPQDSASNIGDHTAVCEAVDLEKKIKAKGYQLSWFSGARFASGGRELWFMAGQGYISLPFKVRLDSPASRADYIALGDSFSSGEGDLRDNTHYLAGTDGTPEYPREKCHVSTRSYPYLINIDTDHSLFHNFACSGATTGDILTSNSRYFGQFNQQKDFKDNPEVLLQFRSHAQANDIRSRTQQSVFTEKYQPKNITITIGGNDAGFGDVLSACVVAGSCAFESTERAAKAFEMRGLYGKLRGTYRKILSSSPDSTLYVLSYPQFIDDDNQCNPNVGLNDTERRFVREGVSYFNSVIRQAALAEGATFIDIEQSLKGSALCSKKILDLAVNGVVAGDDMYKVIGQESFHPNSKGHALIAAYIVDQYGVFPDLQGERCPITSCAHYVAPPVPAYFTELPSTYERYKFAIIDESKEWFERGKNVKVRFENGMSNIVGKLSIHSTPRSLGTVISDTDGVFDVEVMIPSDIEPGYHEIHLETTALDGRRVSYYQPITVIASENDVDGDGVLNERDTCHFVETTGSDSDNDGVDDSCDSVTNVTPATDESNDASPAPIVARREVQGSAIDGVTGVWSLIQHGVLGTESIAIGSDIVQMATTSPGVVTHLTPTQTGDQSDAMLKLVAITLGGVGALAAGVWLLKRR